MLELCGSRWVVPKGLIGSWMHLNAVRSWTRARAVPVAVSRGRLYNYRPFDGGRRWQHRGRLDEGKKNAIKAGNLSLKGNNDYVRSFRGLHMIFLSYPAE